MSASVEMLKPAADANKYSRGKLTVVAGSNRYPGAAVLAALASQRMGAGYTEVITSTEAVNMVRSASPSLVVRDLSDWQPEQLPAFAEGRPCAVCMGSGFVGDEESSTLVARVLKSAACPVLVDGGGLAALGSKDALARLGKRAANGFATVITPHGGEARRLAEALGIAIEEPQQLALALAKAFHAVAVLKGPDTYVSNGESVELMAEGTPALAKAGTGDVLAGMIGALLAQGLEAKDAALLGARLHACAGAVAADMYTDVAVTAEDVVMAIPAALRAAME